jgi:hypothetical protein
MKPRHRTALLTALALFAAAPALAGKWEAIEKLAGETPRTVMVDGNPRLYFRVSPDHPLRVPVDGPARIRLTSRVEFARGKGSVVSYTLRVLDGTREIEHQDTETAPSSRVEAGTGEGGVGKSRRMTVDVPAGRHELRVVAEGVGGVLVRLHQSAGARGETPTVSLTPVEAWRSVIVIEGEKSIPYYSVKAGMPARLRLVGPVTLELITRLDFDSAMRGTQAYRLAVTEKGQRVREVEFKTTKSTTASFGNLADRVPSKFDRLALPFGEGTHDILVELVSPAGAVVEIHARIPQPGTGNEE